MRATITAIGVAVLMGGSVGRADDPTPSLDHLVRMTRCELEGLYRAGEVGPPPCGFVPGRAIFDPGTPAAVRKARLVHVIWKGKEFPGDGTMINRTVAGARAVRAKVTVEDSWFDGRPTVVLDYAETSRLFSNVRDEMREVTSGLWVGVTYVTRNGVAELTNYFALDAR